MQCCCVATRITGTADSYRYNRLLRNIGVTTGFTGCIEMLKVNSSETSMTYDLTRPSSIDVEHYVDISKLVTI